MKALWLEQQHITFRPNEPEPVPEKGDAIVRVRCAGICATDLELVRGYYPFTGIPGHEFVGEVASAPPGSSIPAGTRVVGEINIACGTCTQCRAGRHVHCERRSVLGISQKNGAFAEFLSIPAKNLHPVPESLSDEAAVFTEPLAAALEIQEQIQVRPEDRVLIIGAGRLGQLIARTLLLTGCNLKVVARYERQRSLLAAIDVQCIGEKDIPRSAMDIVIEATGSPEGFFLARTAVRPCGIIVLKSTYRGTLKIDFSMVVVDEITIVGSRCGPFSPALRLLCRGQINPLPLIDARYPLSHAIQALEHAARPGVLKVLLCFE